MNTIPYGTPEWIQARLGKLTASRMGDAMAETKSGGFGASRANYMAELITERLTGKPVDQYVSPAMQRGTELEPEALSAYAFRVNEDVGPGGFVQHPALAMSGGSPDGFVGKLGLVQIKCPNTATHIEYLLTEKIPATYLKQVQWEMACSGRRWCDWVSYDPRLPEEMRLLIIRVPADKATIAKLTAQAQVFLQELDTKVAHLRRRFGSKPALRVVA